MSAITCPVTNSQVRTRFLHVSRSWCRSSFQILVTLKYASCDQFTETTTKILVCRRRNQRLENKMNKSWYWNIPMRANCLSLVCLMYHWTAAAASESSLGFFVSVSTSPTKNTADIFCTHDATQKRGKCGPIPWRPQTMAMRPQQWKREKLTPYVQLSSFNIVG